MELSRETNGQKATVQPHKSLIAQWKPQRTRTVRDLCESELWPWHRISILGLIWVCGLFAIFTHFGIVSRSLVWAVFVAIVADPGFARNGRRFLTRHQTTQMDDVDYPHACVEIVYSWHGVKVGSDRGSC